MCVSRCVGVFRANRSVHGEAQTARVMLLHGIDAADEPRDPTIEVVQTCRCQKHDPDLSGVEMIWSGTSV